MPRPMDNRDKILQLVKLKGPVLPAQINKEVKTNVLFASAMLAELVSNRQLNVSHVKIGGSPLYYTTGQEPKLQMYMNHLNEKDQFTYNKLRSEQVLKDVDQEPLVRVSLRNIKDFAKPLEVDIQGKKILFWKWYLLSQQQAEYLIKQRVVQAQPQPEQPPQSEQQPTPTPLSPTEPSQTPPVSPHHEELQKDIEKSTQAIFERMQAPKKEKPRTKPIPVRVDKKPEPTQTIIKEKESRQPNQVSKQPKPEEKPFEQTFIDKGEPDDAFFKKIKKYFDRNNIKILDYKSIRKNSDFDFEILIPSPVGELHYYCKAKNKKRCNDGDLSATYIQAQSRKLPVFFITTGEITKKALLLLKSEFKNMTIKQL